MRVDEKLIYERKCSAVIVLLCDDAWIQIQLTLINIVKKYKKSHLSMTATWKLCIVVYNAFIIKEVSFFVSNIILIRRSNKLKHSSTLDKY